MKKLIFSAAVCLLAVAPFLSGCEGGNSTTAIPVQQNARTGRASITIKWPPRGTATRLVPSGSESIRVSLTFISGFNFETSLQGAPPADIILTRPLPGEPLETTATFDQLEFAAYTATATAYPNDDATGTPQATATSGQFNVFNGDNAPIRITMGSTIVRATVANSLPYPLGTGLTANVTPTFYDASDAIVLVDPTKITYTPNNPSLASVSAAGVVTPLAGADGDLNVTVTDTESGVSAVQYIRVIPVGFIATGAQISPVGGPFPSPFNVGKSATIELRLSDAMGNFQSVYPTAVTWMSSAPTRATISPAGFVTAISPGVVVITGSVSVNGTVYARTYAFTVVP